MHSAVSSSPKAPPRLTGYFSTVLSAATAALEPARHFAVARLAQGLVPVACAFAGRGARGANLFVVCADGLFFEFALDVQRGGDMMGNFSSLLAFFFFVLQGNDFCKKKLTLIFILILISFLSFFCFGFVAFFWFGLVSLLSFGFVFYFYFKIKNKK